MSSDERPTEIDQAEARDRMTGLASRLAIAMGPVDAANLLAGAAVALLRAAAGDDVARAYFNQLADAIGEDRGTIQ